MHTLPGVSYCFFRQSRHATAFTTDMSSVARLSDIVPGNYRLFASRSTGAQRPGRNLPVHPIFHRADHPFPRPSGKNAQKYPGTQLYYYNLCAGINQMNYVI